MRIVLGVYDVQYGQGALTTGDVAEILEKKYKILKAFEQRHRGMIAKEAMEAILMNVKPVSGGRYIPMDTITHRLKDSVAMREYDGMKGVPTRAAQKGISSRFAKGKNNIKVRGRAITGVPRPSFIDSSNYQTHLVVALKND